MPDNVVASAHRDTAAQAAQAAEAQARREAGNAVNPQERADALDTSASDAGPQDPVRGQQQQPRQDQQQEPPKSKEPALSAFDLKRQQIQARFREEREVEVQPGDVEDAIDSVNRAQLPPELQALQDQDQPEGDQQQDDQQQDDQQAPGEADAPQMVTLKVNGKEIQMPLEEALAKAQIAVASDDILDKAKARLAEINQIAEQAKNATRSAPESHHAPEQRTQPDALDQPQNAPNQGDQRQLIEVIQYGDPEEAQTLLRDTIARETNAAVKKALIDRAMQEEGVRAAKTLKDFSDQHKDLANDPMAVAAMEVTTLQLQRDDLIAIGVDLNQLRPDKQPPTPGDISLAHRWYRSQGYNGLRSPSALLEEALGKYNEWRGVKNDQTADPPPTERAAPRVAVTVDRQNRRQAVQPQPARTTNQTRQVQPPQQPRDRSDVVQAMKARRAQLRGTVI